MASITIRRACAQDQVGSHWDFWVQPKLLPLLTLYLQRTYTLPTVCTYAVPPTLIQYRNRPLAVILCRLEGHRSDTIKQEAVITATSELPSICQRSCTKN